MISKHREAVDYMIQLGYHGLSEEINNCKKLDYKLGFAIILFASLSVNPNLQELILRKLDLGNDYNQNRELLRTHASLLMNSVAVIEAKLGLEPKFISGLVSACLEIDTVCRINFDTEEPIFGFGGMGGDIGLKLKGEKFKTGNSSTLASIILSSIYPVHKHHSRANTSVLGAQDWIEHEGYNSYMLTSEDFHRSLKYLNFVFSSCHHTRSIHKLSHFIKGETINHIIGPLSIPHDGNEPICFIGGVNHNIHPQTEIETLIELEKRGVQRYSGAVSYCGLRCKIDPNLLETGNIPAFFDPTRYCKLQSLKNLVVLDEVSPPPYPTLASFMIKDSEGNKSAKTVIIYPEDFGLYLGEIDIGQIIVTNNKKAIISYNRGVLSGKNISGVKYACMSVALALFAQNYASLPDAFIGNRINSDLLSETFTQALKSFDKKEIQDKLDNLNLI
jgi:anthranilate phosphoribosyltransferase